MLTVDYSLMAQPRLVFEASDDDPDIMEVWMDGELLSSIHVEDVGGWGGQKVLQDLIEKINLQM